MFAVRRAMLVLVLVGCGSAPSGYQLGEVRPVDQTPSSTRAAVDAAIAITLPARAFAEVGVLTVWESDALRALYARREGRGIWVDGRGRPTPHATDAIALLSDAGRHGLNPATYGAHALVGRRKALELTGASIEDVAHFDVVLSAALLRFLRHLHVGRVDPAAIGLRLHAPSERHDIAAALADAGGVKPVHMIVQELSPSLQQYGQLQDALAAYRRLADAVPDRFEFEALTSIDIRTATPAEQRALSERLAALGDRHPTDDVASTDAASLLRAVERFQRRHGLEPDGVIGAATRAALRVPLSWRVRQIELSLERLRWLPDLTGGRVIGLNIPMFTLSAWDADRQQPAPAFTTRAIVGRALHTETPVFVDELREVIFRPYWNVPRSILLKEILPALRRDPGYLRAERMELVAVESHEALGDRVTPDVIERLQTGALRVRQRPGAGNALGLIKFSFPNADNVYLHSTPAPALFARSRRDFSHGCVRVEDAMSLAEWVLKDRPDWTRSQILAATSGDDDRHVAVDPIQVVLFYLTAAVDPLEGSLRFAADIYGQDAALDRALSHP